MNIETAISWFTSRAGKVTYSMTDRLGPNSYDCSSAVYLALKASKHFPSNLWVGNTDSLYGDLERHGWVRLPADKTGYIDARRGDVFLWGKRGASGGALGHTGIFVNANDIIHCAYGYNGIHTDNHDWLWAINGYPEVTIYRYVGTTPNDPHDQILDIGSYIKFPKEYRVDGLAFHHGIWQVRTNELCKVDFTWDENGIPAEPLVEVKDGYATPDQTLAVGSRYVIPGKYKVLDLGAYKGHWLAMVEHKGLKFWVDVETATEIPADAAGTPAPKPTPKPETPKPVEPPKEPEPTIDPPKEETPPESHENEQIPPVKEPNPKEDEDMAFTKEDQEALAIQSKRLEDIAADVAASEGVKEITSSIDRRVKLAVYVVGDALIGFGLLTPNIAIVAGWHDLQAIVALSSALGTGGAFLLTMFGIYKNGK